MAVIFAGNGINQNEGLVYSWEELLDKVVEYLQSEKEKKGDSKAADKKKLERPKVDGLSMTMGFELMEFFRSIMISRITDICSKRILRK